MDRPAKVDLHGFCQDLPRVGDPWDFKAGVNYYPFGNELVRWNTEYLYVRRSPVGALSLPMPVGANGGIFFSSFLLNF